jgi:hypothetical protein
MRAGENYICSARSGVFFTVKRGRRHAIREGTEVCEADPKEGTVLAC